MPDHPSRRAFLKATGASLASLASFNVLPALAQGSPNERIRLAVVGTGVELYVDDLNFTAAEENASGPHAWHRGPHLLLDPALLDERSAVQRQVCPPARFPEPVVTGYEDGNFQPWLTVVRDPDSRRFRLWYNTPFKPGDAGRSHIACLESEDGLHWLRPHRVLRDPAPIQYGASVLDEGPDFANPAQRFKLAWWYEGGLRLAGSGDGFDFTPIQPGVVLAHNHDITSIHWDPLRKRYLALVSVVPAEGPWKGRRIPHQSVSTNLIQWRELWPVVTPRPEIAREQGETQFYGMTAVLARGDLLVGFAKVLRDDLNCEPDKTSADLHDPSRRFAGIGYTVVTWSRDGEHWERETEPFLDRNPQPGTWDRAMAWIDDQLLVGETTYLYYGGYRWGHKAERYTGRQIGFAQMPRDRYVGYEAGEAEGRLLTVARRLEHPPHLTVNAKVNPAEGELRVRIVDKGGQPFAGFDWPDTAPIKGDRVNHPVRWSGDLVRVTGKEVRFEFRMRHATLFAFEVH